ncbi:GTP-binding protein Rheb [Pteropus alecto]|uniref:GTP-binding protein Rheb n=1 Tax=Pteropus alecto TaxID=9402 RepID=L5K0P4_PTEAL|nr:GTP-binding protein Rheb [Pteropus alecto]
MLCEPWVIPQGGVCSVPQGSSVTHGLAMLSGVCCCSTRENVMRMGLKSSTDVPVISYEEGKALAESWNAAFLESSAKENQTAVDVFRRIILEAEKIDGAASQGKSSCSVM